MAANREAFAGGGSSRGCCVTSPTATSVELFGRRLATPFLLAPIGVLEMADRDADVAVARRPRPRASR